MKNLSRWMIGTLVVGMLTGCIVKTGSGGAVRSGGGPGPVVAPGPEPERERILVGRVLDARTKAPIDRVEVEIASDVLQAGINARTDSNGEFRTDPLPPGEFRIRFGREGYQPLKREASVRKGITEVTVELTPK